VETQYPIGPVHLEGYIGFLVMCAFTYWAIRGRIEILVPIQLVLNQWTRTVFVFGVPHLYLVSGALIVAVIARLLRRQAPLYLRGHYWIIPWFALSIAWYVALSVFFGDSGYGTILLILNVAVVIPVLWLHVRSLNAVRVFARVYVATALLGAALAIKVALDYGSTSDLWRDPFMRSGVPFRLLSENYHFLAAPFSVALLLAWALARDASRWVERLCWSAAGLCCVYVLLLIGSRQHVLSAFVGSVLLAFHCVDWREHMGRKVRRLIVATALLSISLYTVAARPELLLRDDEQNTFAPSFVESIVGLRARIWASGLERFAQSPIVGNGPTFNSHNLFVATLANQGIVGFALLLGWLVFMLQVFRTSRSVPFNKESLQWQQALLVIGGMALVAGQASGDMTSLWYLYWAPTLAWCLQSRPRASLLRRVGLRNRSEASRRTASPVFPEFRSRRPAV
jgi:O-antigen ligase